MPSQYANNKDANSQQDETDRHTGESEYEVLSTKPYKLKGIIFLVQLVIVYLVLSYIYALLHGINAMTLLSQPLAPGTLSFDFAGGSKNVVSVGVEIMYWSLVGVIAETAYVVGHSVLVQRQFSYAENVVKWLSKSIYSWGICATITFTFYVISIRIGTVELSLANAPIEVFAALCFILGFYNLEARRLLDRIRGRIAVGIEDAAHQPNPKE